MTIDRRRFLVAGLATFGALAAPRAWFSALGAPVRPGPGPYGPLGAADANGMLLPAGFSSRVIARTFLPVGATTYQWPMFPDGTATFATDDGGWILVCNSEVPELPLGGASAIRFDRDANIVDAYRILEGTSTNCAGGPTPWGTWLSCEETDAGLVWECDPTGERAAVSYPAMGAFSHEAVAVDPVNGQLYLSEDIGDGRFYRYTPAAYPKLDEGILEAAVRSDDGAVRWERIPDPSAAATPTRQQVAATTAFRGGEGLWYDDGVVYFTTKGDNRVWTYDIAASRMDVLYDAADHGESAPLRGVDNIVVAAASGDVFVAEDGDNMELCVITPEGEVAPFMRLEGHESSEVTGPVFDPSGTRLYFSSQRGGMPGGIPGLGSGFGITYEVTGPFRPGAPGGSSMNALSALVGR